LFARTIRTHLDNNSGKLGGHGVVSDPSGHANLQVSVFMLRDERRPVSLAYLPRDISHYPNDEKGHGGRSKTEVSRDGYAT
jgi:hypothetical protein